jgi:hypothetical protein
LLKLGIRISQATVAKYMVRKRKPPSQTWRTFLENHAGQLVAIDFLVVPTVSFRLLYLRRECLDHIVVFSESSLRHILKAYFEYYEHSRPHLSLEKDAPESRAIQPREAGIVVELPQVGGLHHRYERRAA